MTVNVPIQHDLQPSRTDEDGDDRLSVFICFAKVEAFVTGGSGSVSIWAAFIWCSNRGGLAQRNQTPSILAKALKKIDLN